MKFGMDYQNRRNFDDGLFSANEDYTTAPTQDPQNIGGTGSAVASYILGLPTNVLRNIGNTGVHMRWSGFYFYAQDDIHVNSKLTLNLGLRYDYTQWPRDRDNNLGSQDNRYWGIHLGSHQPHHGSSHPMPSPRSFIRTRTILLLGSGWLIS